MEKQLVVLVNGKRAWRIKPGRTLEGLRVKYPGKQIERIREPWPSQKRLEAWVSDSVCKATDGCTVEPDGVCHHGHPSWLLALELI